MLTRSLALVLLATACASASVACGSEDQANMSSSKLSKKKDKGGDDDDDSGKTTKKSSSSSSSGSTSSPTSTPSPKPSTSSTTNKPPSNTPVPSTTTTKPDAKAAGNELNACLTGCGGQDENCANQCFIDLAGNLTGTGGGGGGGGKGLPCCTDGGGLFLCPLGIQCGDAQCTPMPLGDAFCGGDQ